MLATQYSSYSPSLEDVEDSKKRKEKEEYPHVEFVSGDEPSISGSPAASGKGGEIYDSAENILSITSPLQGVGEWEKGNRGSHTNLLHARPNKHLSAELRKGVRERRGKRSVQAGNLTMTADEGQSVGPGGKN